MSDENCELFVHMQGAKPAAVEAVLGETLREVLSRSGISAGDQETLLVFVGECDEALREPEDVENGVDEHAPCDVRLTIEGLELKRHRHVHCHRCRHVLVAINFGGKTKQRRFSPATTIDVVARWARKRFPLDEAAANEYVLQLCNSTEQPRSDVHLGDLVDAPTCSLCFDLVKEVTPQG